MFSFVCPHPSWFPQALFVVEGGNRHGCRLPSLLPTYAVERVQIGLFCVGGKPWWVIKKSRDEWWSLLGIFTSATSEVRRYEACTRDCALFQAKKSFPLTFVISKSNLYKTYFALHYSRIVHRDPRLQWQCSPAALSLMLLTINIFFCSWHLPGKHGKVSYHTLLGPIFI